MRYQRRGSLDGRNRHDRTTRWLCKDLPSVSSALCWPMRWLVTLSKLSTAQLRARPYLAVHDDKSIRQEGMIGCKEIINFESWFDVREWVQSDMKSQKKIDENIRKNIFRCDSIIWKTLNILNTLYTLNFDQFEHIELKMLTSFKLPHR